MRHGNLQCILVCHDMPFTKSFEITHDKKVRFCETWSMYNVYFYAIMTFDFLPMTELCISPWLTCLNVKPSVYLFPDTSSTWSSLRLPTSGGRYMILLSRRDRTPRR